MTRLQTGCLQTVFTVAYEHTNNKTVPIGNCNLHLENSLLQRGVLKCPVSYVLNFRGLIKLIFDTVNGCNFFINESHWEKLL